MNLVGMNGDIGVACACVGWGGRVIMKEIQKEFLDEISGGQSSTRKRI